jgi:hypothetical protein
MRSIVTEQSSVAKCTGKTLRERERERERKRERHTRNLGVCERIVWEWMFVYQLSNYQCLQKDPVP